MYAPGVTWADRKRRLFAAVATAAFAATGVGQVTAYANPTPVGASANESADFIVQARPGEKDVALRSITALGGEVTHTLDAVNGFTVTLPVNSLGAASTAAGVLSVTSDVPVKLQGAAYAPATEPGAPQLIAQNNGATKMWEAGSYGQGIGVAVLDSGVAKVDGLRNNVFYGPDLSPEGQDMYLRNLDTFGHGTFMAGLVAGRTDGAARPYVNNFGSSTYLGMAPEAKIVSVKVADALGNTQQSTIIRGIDWIIQHRNDPGLNIRVLNLSLGSDNTAGYQNDPLAAAAERAWAAGIVVVASAGNDGAYTYCAPENGVCNFVGTANVVFGANGKFVTRQATNSISCSNSVFGDPNVGAWKGCFFRLVTPPTTKGPPDNQTFCSSESGTCAISGTANVAFGVGNKWTFKDVTGSVACNTANFGDPAPGVRKACFFRPTGTLPVGPVGLLLPAADPYIISVGAIDNYSTAAQDDDRLADFSNRGSLEVRTPDMSAMGTHIVGLRVPGSYIDQMFGASSAASATLMRGSGTSQSAAVTSGAVALVLSRYPTATPDQVKLLLRSEAKMLPGLTRADTGRGALYVGNIVTSAPRYANQVYTRAANWSTPSTNWSGGTWSNGVWTASGTTAPTTTYTDARWTGSRWTGSRWTGSRWTGSVWSGSRWTEYSWS